MSRRLTVVQALPALESGGLELGVLEVAEGLVRAGHRAVVVSAGGRLVSRLEGSGAEHVRLELGRKSVWTLRHARRLRRLLRALDADVLDAQSRLPAWIAWLAWRRMPGDSRPRLVTSVQGLHSVSRYSASVTFGERVVCVSEAARRYVLENYPRTEPGRLVVIPRGVDRRFFPFRYQPRSDWLAEWLRRLPALESRRVLTQAGRLRRRKGFEAHIDLVAALHHDGLDVHGLAVGPVAAGDERYFAELRRRVEQRGIGERYTFLGQRDDVREIFAVSDLVLALSAKPEAFGRTVAEALALGRPVLGWDQGGVGEQLRELYPHGAVAPGDADALAARARLLLERPPPVPSDLPYTRERMLARTLALYESLAGERGG